MIQRHLVGNSVQLLLMLDFRSKVFLLHDDPRFSICPKWYVSDYSPFGPIRFPLLFQKTSHYPNVLQWWWTKKQCHVPKNPRPIRLPCDLGRLDFVSCTAAPAFEIRQHFTLLPVHARMHLAPPLLSNYGSVYTRWRRPSGPSDLSGEAGALHRLRSLLDLILVAASVCSNDLTRARLHMNNVASVRRGAGDLSPQRHHTDGQQQRSSAHAL